MSRDKQIEEIVKDFCPLYQEYGSCTRCNQSLDIDDEPCYYGCVANIIIDYGYRKASEVALEAVDAFQSRIRNIFCTMCDDNDYNTLNLLQIDEAIEALYDTFIAELKKKYTEIEKDNG